MWKLQDRFVPATLFDAKNSSSGRSAETSPRNAAAQERLRIPPGIRTERCTILFVGGESLALTNVLMTHGGSPVCTTVTFCSRSLYSLCLRFCKVYSYEPSTRGTRLESPRSNSLLMRRYAMVHKARDADVFGILVGTLGIGRTHERAPGRPGLIA